MSRPEDIADLVQRALAFAIQSGQIDGEHHKAWVIDQMVRALTGCPIVQVENRFASTPDGKGFCTITFQGQGENDEYRRLTGDDWNVGVSP